MARLLMSALVAGGHKTALASDFRSYEGTGDPALQSALAAAGRVEADYIIETCLSQPVSNRPNVWFTYHLYYKAPDYLGPAVSDALGIPYVVAEPSHAPKRAGGFWNIGHQSVETSLKKADCAFCLTKHDMACVEPALSSPDRLFYLPPFLDTAAFTALKYTSGSNITVQREQLAQQYGLNAEILLVAVGMMRKGDKFESYRQLTEALEQTSSTNWQLVIIGDGEMRQEIEFLFRNQNNLMDRVVFVGEQTGENVVKILAASDICVWPAAGEAYGMALLEAQAAGLPVVAGNLRGVPDVVENGKTAILVPPGDARAFAQGVDKLINNKDFRIDMGLEAARFVRNKRSLMQAAKVLNTGLNSIVM